MSLVDCLALQQEFKVNNTLSLLVILKFELSLMMEQGEEFLRSIDICNIFGKT
jgi:hypothetical protein